MIATAVGIAERVAPSSVGIALNGPAPPGVTLNGPVPGVFCGAWDGCVKNWLHRDTWVEEGPSTTIGTSATDDSRPLRKRFMLVCVCVHASIYLRTAREAINKSINRRSMCFAAI